jgi:hypothetical protein
MIAAAPVTISPEGLVFRVVESYSTFTKDPAHGWINHAPRLNGYARHGVPIAKIYAGPMEANLRAAFARIIPWDDLVSR